jgi:hypothetical protein
MQDSSSNLLTLINKYYILILMIIIIYYSFNFTISSPGNFESIVVRFFKNF